MTEYTASNGIEYGHDSGGIWKYADGDQRYMDIGSIDLAGLREFFQHERDEALGRWRWPENPDYVVYPSSRAREASVVAESVGCWGQWSEKEARNEARRDKLAAAAVAYFDARPETKPWQSAQDGELWYLDVEGIAANMLAVRNQVGEVEFVSLGRRMNAQYWAIKSGQRIWPDTSEES